MEVSAVVEFAFDDDVTICVCVAVLALKPASPLYVAVKVLMPVLVGVSVQSPTDVAPPKRASTTSVPVQSTVPSAHHHSACRLATGERGHAEVEAITACETVDGLGTEVTVVVVPSVVISTV